MSRAGFAPIDQMELREAKRADPRWGRLKEIATDLGQDIHLTEFYDTKIGAWVPDLNRIYLDMRLSIPEMLTVLAHEVGHVVHDHREGEYDDWEREADTFAARLLIDADEWAMVTALRPAASRTELAEHFGVAWYAIDDYRKWVIGGGKRD